MNCTAKYTNEIFLMINRLQLFVTKLWITINSTMLYSSGTQREIFTALAQKTDKSIRSTTHYPVTKTVIGALNNLLKTNFYKLNTFLLN